MSRRPVNTRFSRPSRPDEDTRSDYHPYLRRGEQARSRSRSRSPSPDRSTTNKSTSTTTSITTTSKIPREDDLVPAYEDDRRSRMARLRAQNEEEERQLALIDRTDSDLREAQRRARKAKEEIFYVDPKELEGLDEEEQMQRLLGFSGFATTKGTEVLDNQTTAAKGATAKHKARKYRQYMNRKGGFNRPLDEMD
jgi:U4/U6.U5 tri-snRNP-associated protein 3